jgi:hypothetical protein
MTASALTAVPRWLTRNQQDAEDMAQEAFLSFETFEGSGAEDARAWLLTVVRNTCFTWLRKRGGQPADGRRGIGGRGAGHAGLPRRRPHLPASDAGGRVGTSAGSGLYADHQSGPAPENMKIIGPAEAPVPRLKAEFRYQMLIKSGSRKALNALLKRALDFARERKWNATALVIDVDPLTLL